MRTQVRELMDPENARIESGFVELVTAGYAVKLGMETDAAVDRSDAWMELENVKISSEKIISPPRCLKRVGYGLPGQPWKRLTCDFIRPQLALN